MENRLIRMAELPKLEVETGAVTAEAPQQVKVLGEEHFDNQKSAAIKKLEALLNLDASRGISTESTSEEKKKFDELKKDIENKFTTLKINYRKEAYGLGESQEQRDRFDVYKKAVEDFLTRMEFSITQINFEQGSDTAKQQEVEKLLRSYFSQKEVRGKDAFIPYLAKALIADCTSFDALKAAENPQAVTELFKKWFEGTYVKNKGYESPLLQSAIKSMYEGLPSFEAKAEETTYFNEYLKKKPELIAKFGARNTKNVVQVLAKRFDITFKDNNPDYFVDLANNYRCLLVKDIESYLDGVIKSDFTNAESVAKVETKLDETKTTRDNAYKAMTESGETGDYIDDLTDFAESPEVTTVLNMAQNYRNNMDRMMDTAGADQLVASVDAAMQPAYESVRRNLTPEKVASIPRESGQGFAEAVAAIIRMINELINGKDSKGLAQANKDLEEGKNPTVAQKEIMEKCKTACADKPLDQLLNAYITPEDASGLLKDHKNAPYFSSVAKDAVKAALNDKLNAKKLAFVDVKKEGNNFELTVKATAGDTKERKIQIASDGTVAKLDGADKAEPKPKVKLAQDQFATSLASLLEIKKEQPKTITDFLVANHSKGTVTNGVLTLSDIGAKDYIHNVLKPDADIPKGQAVFVVKGGEAIKIEKGKATVAKTTNVDTWVLASGQSYEYGTKKTKIDAGKRVLVDSGDKIVLATENADDKTVLAMVTPPSSPT
ncbi:hypothetical protein JXA05_02020 [Candidatus Peregrinibacteria bacterium]|nr:hypothetical protein [Candidatus Peregrinibacteria bacterium]